MRGSGRLQRALGRQLKPSYFTCTWVQQTDRSCLEPPRNPDPKALDCEDAYRLDGRPPSPPVCLGLGLGVGRGTYA